MATMVKPLMRKLIIDFLAFIFTLKLLLKDTDAQREGMGAVCWKSFCAVFNQYFFHLIYGMLLSVIRGIVILLNIEGQRHVNQPQATIKIIFLLFLAAESIVLAMLSFKETTFYSHWFNDGLSDGWKLVREFTEKALICLYVTALGILSVIRRAKPVRLGPKLKYVLDGGFILICLAISKSFDDLASVILLLSLCFHIIPVAQLIFDVENYGVFDTLLALCLETAIHLHKYPRAAPFAVIFLSFGMPAVKHIAGRG